MLLKELTALDPEKEEKASSLIGDDTDPQVVDEVVPTMSPGIPGAGFDPKELFQTPRRASYTPSETGFLQDAADRLMKGIHKARGKISDPAPVEEHSSARENPDAEFSEDVKAPRRLNNRSNGEIAPAILAQRDLPFEPDYLKECPIMNGAQERRASGPNLYPIGG